MAASRLAALAALALFSLGVASGARAQETHGADTIVVTGERAEEIITEFVSEVTVRMQGIDQLGRWDRRICPGIAGFRTPVAHYVVDRIAQRARDVGLGVGEPGCRANIFIVVTRDADDVTQGLFERNRRAFGYYSQRGRRTLGRSALQDFVEADTPVRWWHIGRTVMQDGDAIGVTDNGAPPRTNIYEASRLRRTARLDFESAIIVVDVDVLVGRDLELPALADYLAMVSLAQLDFEADVAGLPTILNLFESAEAPRALSDWDEAYLRGLYAAAPTESADRQERAIARTILAEHLSE